MQIYSMILPTIIASLCATGCSLLLVRRGPSRRLRYLTLTVGLMSFSQTANLLHIQGVWTGGSSYVVNVHQSLVAGLSLLAMYLLAAEVYDRNLTDRRLRLAEHELLMAGGRREKAEPAGLLSLVQHVGTSKGLSVAATVNCCGECLGIMKEIAASWQGLYFVKAGDAGREQEDLARERLAQALRARLDHEISCGHDVVEGGDKATRLIVR